MGWRGRVVNYDLVFWDMIFRGGEFYVLRLTCGECYRLSLEKPFDAFLVIKSQIKGIFDKKFSCIGFLSLLNDYRNLTRFKSITI